MPISDVYCQLKQRILLGELEPGTALQEKGLADEFGVSRTPIREALIRLESDGLVRIVPKQGVYVSEITHKSFRDAYEIRYLLIAVAGKLAAQRMTNEELDRLETIVDRLKGETEIKSIQALDMEFHDNLNCSSHNGLLAETLQRLRSYMPRIWVTTFADSEYFSQTIEEHQKIWKALKERDGDEAGKLLQSHIGRYREYVNGLPDLSELSTSP